jgi:hypothetical protein
MAKAKSTQQVTRRTVAPAGKTTPKRQYVSEPDSVIKIGRIQSGEHSVIDGNSLVQPSVLVSFPQSFGHEPIVIVTPIRSEGYPVEIIANITEVSSDSFALQLRGRDGSFLSAPVSFHYIAIG